MQCLPAAAACTLVVFGLTVSDVVEDAMVQRDLDAVELWSGVEAIVSAAQEAGFVAQGFDKYRIRGVTDTKDPSTTEDILLEAGFRKALNLVLRVRPGGLLWMAPVCSSWILLNLKCTKRTTVGGPRFSGNLHYLPVREGNLMAEMAAFLFSVAVLRGAQAVLENPAASMLFNYEVAKTAWEAVWPECFWAVLPHCRFSSAPFGRRFGKKFKLMASHPWVQRLACKCKCPGRVHQPLATSKVVNGKCVVTGCKQALKDSAAYPLKMGIAVIDAWICNSGPDEMQGPRSTGRKVATGAKKAKGPRSTGAQKPSSKNTKKSWASLTLDDTSVSTSSSSQSSSGRTLPHWSCLDLQDDCRDGVRFAVAGWQALALEDSPDFSPPQQAHAWQHLSLDDE